MKKYVASNKAYYDAISGLIPVKVVKVNRFANTVTIQSLKTVAGFYKGETTDVNPAWVIPQCELFTRNRQFHVHTFYAWIETEEGIKNIRTRGEY